MKRSKPNKRISKKSQTTWPFLVVLIVVFTISAVISNLYLKDKFAFESSFIEDLESRYDEAGDDEQKEGVRLYESPGSGPGTEVGAKLRKDRLLVVVEDIIKKHIKPYGGRLLDMYLDREGTIYIDLDDGIKKSFKGDASEELNIVAGLYRGIRPVLPELKAMKILIEGREAESLGGHINILKPIGVEIAGNIR
jgi:hypothetical protein